MKSALVADFDWLAAPLLAARQRYSCQGDRPRKVRGRHHGPGFYGVAGESETVMCAASGVPVMPRSRRPSSSQIAATDPITIFPRTG